MGREVCDQTRDQKRAGQKETTGDKGGWALSEEQGGNHLLVSIWEQDVWIKESHRLPPTFKSQGREKAKKGYAHKVTDLRRKQGYG